MNTLRKNIIWLFVVSCLVLTACGGNTSTDESSGNDTNQEIIQADDTTVQENVENTVISEQSQESETTQTEEITTIIEAIDETTSEEVTNTIETEETTLEEVETIEHLTASDVLDYLKANSENIGEYIEYTEETDTNNLLGRPNQYISKINAQDLRIEQKEGSDPVGVSIEVFNNNEDAVARKDYITSLGQQMSFLVEYDYVNDYILLRVNNSLTPTQAEEYETLINNIFN